jgi:hypothetical protein
MEDFNQNILATTAERPCRSSVVVALTLRRRLKEASARHRGDAKDKTRCLLTIETNSVMAIFFKAEDLVRLCFHQL